MKTLLFRLWQWVWGFPQNLLGLILSLVLADAPRSQYRQCQVIRWSNGGSMSLGMYLFLGSDDPRTYIHEYGHSIQSAILGPLFLPIMGIPSFLWCNLPPCRKLRREKGISYYWFYPESTANYLGSLVTGQICDLK